MNNYKKVDEPKLIYKFLFLVIFFGLMFWGFYSAINDALDKKCEYFLSLPNATKQTQEVCK